MDVTSSTTKQSVLTSSRRDHAHPRDAKIVEKVRAWESQVCDFVDMLDVTVAVAETAMGKLNKEPDALDRRRIMFLLYDVSSKIEAFKEAYYEAIELH